MGAGLGFSNRLTGWGSFGEAFVSSRAIVMRRFVLAAVTVLCVGTGSLVFGSTLALAAVEAPEVSVQTPVPATSATVHGVLDPGKEGSPGTYELGRYEFLYSKASNKTGCGGEGKAPASPGIALGAGKESVSESLPGLEPSTEYAVCLVFHNELKEEAVSPEVLFKTAALPLPLETPITTSPVTAISASSATLHGVLSPGGKGEAGSYEFVYERSVTDCRRFNPHTALQESEYATPSEKTSGAKEEVSAPVSGLLPGTAYAFCLLARNEAGEVALGLPVFFTTESASPTVEGESVSKIGAHSASVTAQVDPGGIATSYSVQYGTTTAYGSEEPGATISSSEANTVSVSLANLEPNTEYHFRVTATNKDGSVTGNDMTLFTYQAEVSGLPDGRVYELVSQFDNPDAEVFDPDEAADMDGSRYSIEPYGAVPDGDAVVFTGSHGRGGNGVETQEKADEYYALRYPQGGWSIKNISAPDTQEAEYLGFSSDLSVGVTSAGVEPPIVTTEAPRNGLEGSGTFGSSIRVLYARSPTENVFRPFFKKVPSHRVYDYEFVELVVGDKNQFHTQYVGSSADGSYQLFSANEDLLEGEGRLEDELSEQVEKEIETDKEAVALLKVAHERTEQVEALEAVGDRQELYVSVGGKPSLVNVSSGGRVEPDAAFADSAPISADGSRIFWESEEPVIPYEFTAQGAVAFVERPKALFVREDGSRTIQVSPGPAQLQAISPDGKYAFYIEAGRLWRFDVENQTRVELAGSEEHAQGVVGTNEAGEDGAYVYFVAQEVLTAQPNAAGQSAVAGEDNLYVDEPDPQSPGGSKTVFIGALSGVPTARLTPDGHGLVFSSNENLIGSTYGDEGSEEVYVYDAGDASLFCASCRAQASGGSLDSGHRWISENGDLVFFNSSAPLVAQDVNGEQDVYEWERDGSGSCREQDGCVYLLSNGVEGAATLVDASANGSDVFFATRQALVPEVDNEIMELYDARVDGGLPVSPPECTGTGCQGVPAAAPIFATPASVTFAGVGNFPPPATSAAPTAKAKPLTRAQKLTKALKACRKKRDRGQRAVCEAHAQKQYGAKTKARMSTKREGK